MSSEKNTKSCKETMKEVTICETELAYITAVDTQSKTFFAQLCKNSNEDLIQFNKVVQKFCNDIEEARKAGDKKKDRPKEVKVGDVLCAKYPADRQWYRAAVLNVNQEAKTCSVMYIDYGNTETVSFRHLIEVDPEKFPTIIREPFGITCSLLEEYIDGVGSNKILDVLKQTYLMLRMKAPQKDDSWKVTIPKHAYNVPFWRVFEKIEKS